MKFIKRQIEILFASILYFTRIPLPHIFQYKPEIVNRAIIYFPVIGLLIALMSGYLIIGLDAILPYNIAVILTMVFNVMITGALHNDGLADVADGFGGGWKKEQILTIMKDSHIGAYGTIALILFFITEYATIISIPVYDIVLLFMFAHVVSRTMSALTVFVGKYARINDSTSRAADVAKPMKLSSFLFALIPLVAILVPYIKLLWIPTIVVVVVWFLLFIYFKRRIGGYTGDCLGTIQQITYLTSLITIVAIWQ